MKKKQYTGYGGRAQREAVEAGFLVWDKSFGEKLPAVLHKVSEEDAVVFKTKGKPENWDADDWPPLKISIIVTVEETE
jgi:hypothetical protein